MRTELGVRLYSLLGVFCGLREGEEAQAGETQRQAGDAQGEEAPAGALRKGSPAAAGSWEGSAGSAWARRVGVQVGGGFGGRWLSRGAPIGLTQKLKADISRRRASRARARGARERRWSGGGGGGIEEAGGRRERDGRGLGKCVGGGQRSAEGTRLKARSAFSAPCRAVCVASSRRESLRSRRKVGGGQDTCGSWRCAGLACASRALLTAEQLLL